MHADQFGRFAAVNMSIDWRTIFCCLFIPQPFYLLNKNKKRMRYFLLLLISVVGCEMYDCCVLTLVG